MANNHVTNKYFLEQSGKPRVELTFLEHTDIPRWRFWPVDNGSKWVALEFVESNPPKNNHLLEILVFDDTHLLHKRTIKCKYPPGQVDHAFRFENGNQNIIYWTGNRFEGYDIASDTAAEWKPKN